MLKNRHLYGLGLLLAVATMVLVIGIPVSAAGHKYVMIGDSYSDIMKQDVKDGYPYSWPDFTAQYANIPSSSWTAYRHDGAGFLSSGSPYKTFYEYFQSDVLKKNASPDKSVDRVILAGGVVNDFNKLKKLSAETVKSRLRTRMKELDTALRKKYPNAKIMYAGMHWCVPGTKASDGTALRTVFNTRMAWYREIAESLKWKYMASVDYVLRAGDAEIGKYFLKDGLHPNIRGKRALGIAIANEVKEYNAAEDKAKEREYNKEAAFVGLHVISVTENSIRLTWKKVEGASKYILCGCKYGQKFKKIGTFGGSVLESTRKKLAKGSYYVFRLDAYNSKGKYMASSRRLFVATRGGKYTNACAVSASPSAISLKAGSGQYEKIRPSKTLRDAGKTERVFKEYTYFSTKPKIASVSADGLVRGLHRGECRIYVIAQSGASKAVTVKVS